MLTYAISVSLAVVACGVYIWHLHREVDHFERIANVYRNQRNRAQDDLAELRDEFRKVSR